MGEYQNQQSKVWSKKAEQGCGIGSLPLFIRRNKAYDIRVQAAQYQKHLPYPNQICNGDEKRFDNKIASYSKAFPHNDLGQVDLLVYKNWIQTLKSGNPKKFDSLQLGGVVKLKNPQAGYAYDLVGADCQHLSIAPAPSFSSAWEASEMAELYWQALTRDVPFYEYGHNRLIEQAAADLSSFSDFRGPKVEGTVTVDTLFRGDTCGDLTGPYISQFLWKDVPYGATKIIQKYRIGEAGIDYMTGYEEWLAIQNGSAAPAQIFAGKPRYIHNGRGLAEFVHQDFSYQACLSACLILLSFGQEAMSISNPYIQSKTQCGFATFGAPHVLDLVGRASKAALEAAWFQKFFVHRRLRPEEFAGHVHNHLTGADKYSIHEDLLRSQAVSEVHRKYGTYLLPMAYPEGCPAHPAYPSGHASFAGAGVTMLKAFFNESFVIPDPVEANVDGRSLRPYKGEPLTVGGELNKLAANVGIGRDTAGVHWRSDISEGLKLGETVAIEILRDYKDTYNEDFAGFTFTKFDGTQITI